MMRFMHTAIGFKAMRSALVGPKQWRKGRTMKNYRLIRLAREYVLLAVACFKLLAVVIQLMSLAFNYLPHRCSRDATLAA